MTRLWRVELGADVPPSALADAIRRVRTPVTAALWSQTAETADMDTVRAVGPRANVLLGGPGWYSVDEVASAVRVHNLREAVERCAGKWVYG